MEKTNSLIDFMKDEFIRSKHDTETIDDFMEAVFQKFRTPYYMASLDSKLISLIETLIIKKKLLKEVKLAHPNNIEIFNYNTSVIFITFLLLNLAFVFNSI